MRVSLYSALCAMVMVATTMSSATAQCFGDAAEMYGCESRLGAPQGNSGELVRFGGDSAPVIPDTGRSSNGSSTDDLFTEQERRRMMRSIVQSGGRQSYSRQAFTRSMTSGSRPIRRWGNTRIISVNR